MAGGQRVDLADEAGEARRIPHDARVAAHAGAKLGQRRFRKIGRGVNGGRRRARIGGLARSLAGAGPEGRSLQERIGGQPVRALHAGRGALAGGEEACERRPPVGVGDHAAHVIVGRGRHRYGLAARIDAAGHAGGEDGGEFLGEALANGRAGIEEGAATARDRFMDGAGDDVAGRKIPERVAAGHDRGAGRVDEHGAFAAQGFAGEGRGVGVERDRGRVELHELGVADQGARERRQRQALADEHARVGGHGVEAAEAAGGEQRRRGDDLE